MPGFYTAQDRVNGPALRQPLQMVGTIASIGERGGAPIYEVATRHPASGKPWLLHGVRETVSRFYKADSGRWQLGDRVIVARAGSSIFEIIGAAPDGRNDDTASIVVGGSVIEVDGGSDGISVSVGDTSQRIAGEAYYARHGQAAQPPRSQLRLSDDGPYLASERWAQRNVNGVQETRGTSAPEFHEDSYYYLALDASGVSGVSQDTGGRGFLLPVYDTALNSLLGYAILPARLDRARRLGQSAAGNRGALDPGAPMVPYVWAAPTLSDVGADFAAGQVNATVTVAVPPNVSLADLRLLMDGAADSDHPYFHQVAPVAQGGAQTLYRLPGLLGESLAQFEFERRIAGGLQFKLPVRFGRDYHYLVASTHPTEFAGQTVPASAGLTRASALAAVADNGLRPDTNVSAETQYYETLVTVEDQRGRVLPSLSRRYALAIFRVYP